MSRTNDICIICKKNAEMKCSCNPTEATFCYGCTGVHMSKGGAHTFFPTFSEISSPEQVAQFNIKLQHVRTLRAQLEIMSSCLLDERGRLDAAFKEWYDSLNKQLWEACGTAFGEVIQQYKTLEDSIERAKQELDASLGSSTTELSDDTIAFVTKAAHFSVTGRTIFNQNTELSARVSVVCRRPSGPAPSILSQVLDSWDAKQCGCPTCMSIQSSLFPRTPRRSVSGPPITYGATIRSTSKYPQAVRSCPQCRTENPTSAVLCATCCRLNEDEAAPWSCLSCKTQNLQAAEGCQNCRIKRGLSAFLIKKGVLMSTDARQWKCYRCSRMSSLRSAQCENCGAVNTYIDEVLRSRT